MVLPVGSLYGTKAPFSSSSNGADVVHMFTIGNYGNRVSSFLLFHKVQKPGTDFTTGFAVVRTY